MKLIIIIVVALVLALGAAAGVFFALGGKLPEAEKLTRLPPPSEDVLEHWPVDLGSLPFPVYRGGKISGFSYVKVTLTLRGDYDAKFLDGHVPVFKDEILRKYFSEKVPRSRDGLRINYVQIEKDIQKMIDDRFLPGLVLNVAAEFSPG